jgi:endonuclease G
MPGTRYRRTHQREQKAGLRLSTLVILLLVVLISVFLLKGKLTGGLQPATPSYTGPEILAEYMPGSGKGQTVHHRHFSLSYAEDYEQAEWVAYELTREELDAPRVPRHDWFNADYNVRTRSAFHRDYSGSGYTRGHLAPAADMGFDTLAMRESFYMSNISPQVRAFNNGIWRELEEQTRDWVRDAGRLYIVAGPILHKGLDKYIGENRVAVPEYFYKVLLDPDEPDIKGIGFVIPNSLSEKPLMDYAVSIDSVERLTQLDFFPLLDNLEGVLELESWSTNERRFRTRVNEWNKQ